MSRNVKLRTLLGAIVVPPIVLLGLIAAYGVLIFLRGAPSTEDFRKDVFLLSMVAVAGMLISAAMVFVIGRRVLQPIGEISDAATELADVRLPLLIQSLSTPGAVTPEFDPLEVKGKTELADLGRALNLLQDRAVTVAAEQQRVVKEGISELVINLARRNQSLLDRQIDTIDELESNEENPDRLEKLFRLDHLATRMRRNAESLLVLAGAEPSRRRGGPVILSDVVRVAMSEIEDYQHVTLGELTPAHIGAQGAVDVAHLMSELLENATQFSPPDQPVQVVGSFTAEGPYAIQVVDHGIGMSAEQLAAANEILQNPPELGLALTRSLGFQVIGRLARRIGVAVEIRHSEGGGTTAIVWIPADVLSAAGPAAAPVPEAFLPQPGGIKPGAHPAAGHEGAAGVPAEAFDWATPEQQVPVVRAESAPPVTQPAPTFQHEPQQPPQAAPAPSFAPEVHEPVAEEPAGLSAEDFTNFFGEEPPPGTAVPQPATHDYDQAASAFQQAAPAPAPTPAPAPAPAPAPTFDEEQHVWEQPAPHPAPAPAPAFEQEPHGWEQPAAAQGTQPAADPMAAPWEVPATPDPTRPAQQLEQAVPTGPAFESGVDALLDDPNRRTGAGLVRRDRSQSTAPPSEGRSIANQAAAASVRSPDEIRSMLAQYREGLKGRPGGDPGNPIQEQPR